MSERENETEDVLVPGGRDVRGTLDVPDDAADGDADAVVDAAVVACPPHPQFGGKRTDVRLRAVSDRLTEAGIACLRFDYGPWAGGAGELADARNALDWTRDRYARVGLFGYSFGGAVALLAAAREDPPPAAVSALAPAARISEGLDAVAALDDIACPVQVVYGERDTTADWEPIVERARKLGYEVVEVGADHHFVGQAGKVAGRVGAFLVDACSRR